jgi:hypothetical protein
MKEVERQSFYELPVDIRKELEKVYDIVFLEESGDCDGKVPSVSLLSNPEEEFGMQSQKMTVDARDADHQDSEQLPEISPHKEYSSTKEIDKNAGYQYDPTQHDLPPWSQLNPTDLLAMPDNMRAKVLKQYSEQDQGTTIKKRPISPSQSHQTPKRTRTRRTPGQKNSSSQNNTRKTGDGQEAGAKRSFTLTQLFPPQSPSKQRSVINPVDDLSEWDPNVLNELPAGKIICIYSTRYVDVHEFHHRYPC